MTRTEFQEVLDRTLKPFLRATEHAGGSDEQIQLREARREQRKHEAARRQETREAEREDKSRIKTERKVFESLGFSKSEAKRAAKAGVPHVSRAIHGTVTFSEAETKQREGQRELQAVERTVAKAERKDAVRVFESLGMPKEAAKFAARGR